MTVGIVKDVGGYCGAAMIHSYKVKDQWFAEALLNRRVVVCTGQTDEDARLNLDAKLAAKLAVLKEDSSSAINKLRQDKMSMYKVMSGNQLLSEDES